MKSKILIMLMGFFLFSHQMFAQDVSISGNVKDEKGEALIGVTIQVKGTTTGNITDVDVITHYRQFQPMLNWYSRTWVTKPKPFP